MPRPKSKLTNNRRYVGIPLTPSQHKEWELLGKQKFLREFLDKSKQYRKEVEAAKATGGDV